MLPAVLFFAGIDIINGNIWPELGKRFSYLTMLMNFAYPFLSINPGVYWYFGLTFQFYLLWAFFGKRMNGSSLLIWSVVLLLALLGISNFADSNTMSIFRHCFTGWFPVLAIGLWMGLRNNKEDLKPKSIWVELLLLVVLLGLILVMGNWVVTWILIPIVALAWFIVIGLLLLRTRYLSEVFRWIGKYSACIFVCHPIARYITHFVELRISTIQNVSLLVIVCVYLAITVIIALVYSVIYHWLNSRLIREKA